MIFCLEIIMHSEICILHANRSCFLIQVNCNLSILEASYVTSESQYLGRFSYKFCFIFQPKEEGNQRLPNQRR